MKDLEIIKEVIDHFIELVGKTDGFKCPETHMKSYYLKCCHLVYAYQVGIRAKPNDEIISANLKKFKEWMPVLREAKI